MFMTYILQHYFSNNNFFKRSHPIILIVAQFQSNSELFIDGHLESHLDNVGDEEFFHDAAIFSRK